MADDLTVYDVPRWASKLAQAALDALLPGRTVFGIGDGWADPEMEDYREFHLGALVTYLRGKEPLPDVLRNALANALDPSADPPIRLVTKNGRKRPSPASRFRELDLQQLSLPIYEQARAEGLPSADSYAKVARQLRIDEDTARKMVTAARGAREFSEQIGPIMRSAQSVGEAFKAIENLGNRPRKRGRPKMGTKAPR